MVGEVTGSEASARSADVVCECVLVDAVSRAILEDFISPDLGEHG